MEYSDNRFERYKEEVAEREPKCDPDIVDALLCRKYDYQYGRHESTLPLLRVIKVNVLRGTEAEVVKAMQSDGDPDLLDSMPDLDEYIPEMVLKVDDGELLASNTFTINGDFGSCAACWNVTAEFSEDEILSEPNGYGRSRDFRKALGLVHLDYGGWGELCAAYDLDYFDAPGTSPIKQRMVRLVLAFLQSQSERIYTPRQAESMAEQFIRELDTLTLETLRKCCEPSVTHLMHAARLAAETISTGIDSLDSMLHGGFTHGGLYMLAADPGAGKTALAVMCMLFSSSQCSKNERAVYVMLDQGGNAEIMKRLLSLSHAIATEGGEGCELSRASEWATEEVNAAKDAYLSISNSAVVLLEQESNSFEDITKELEAIYKRALLKPRLVVVDYYQRMDYDGRSVAYDSEAAANVAEDMRTWSYRYHVPFILIGTFSKEAVRRHERGEQPSMNDLLGSGDIPYASESVLVMTNAHDGSGIVELRDLKHRHAGNDAQQDRVCKLHLDGEHGLFSEVE